MIHYAKQFVTGLAACTVLQAALLQAALAQAEPQMLRGTVISAAADKLVVKDTTGAEKSFSVGMEARITVHGKPGKLEDLQETMPIHITTDEKGKVLAVATVDKHKRSGDIVLVSTSR